MKEITSSPSPIPYETDLISKVKGTVNVISIDPPLKEWHVRFAMVSLKLCLFKFELDIHLLYLKTDYFYLWVLY